MATTMDASAGRDRVSRKDFDEFAERLAAAERLRPPASTPSGDAFVRQDEFRLFKWVVAFAMASLLGGIGVLYQMTSDLSVSVERGFGQVREQLGRIETRLDGVEKRLDGVESRLDDLEARSRWQTAEGRPVR